MDVQHQHLDFIDTHIKQSIAVKRKILEDRDLIDTISKIADMCIDAFKRGNKVMLAGNGGSAADSQHIAAEFVSRFRFDRPGLPSIALTTDTSMLTAIGNDYGYESLFSRQLEANGRSGDIFIGLTTSGNSANIIKAAESCKDLKIMSVGLLGHDGGKAKNLFEEALCVPSNSTALVQESHIMIGHIICGFVEDTLFANFK